MSMISVLPLAVLLSYASAACNDAPMANATASAPAFEAQATCYANNFDAGCCGSMTPTRSHAACCVYWSITGSSSPNTNTKLDCSGCEDEYKEEADNIFTDLECWGSSSPQGSVDRSNKAIWDDGLKPLTSIILTNNQIQGTIPLFWFNHAKDVQTFELNNNNLQGSLPSAFKQLTQLTTLDINRNKFTGNLDSVPSSLKKLVANGNKLQGTIPAYLSQLTELRIQSNSWTGCIPANIAPCNTTDAIANNFYNTGNWNNNCLVNDAKSGGLQLC